MNTSTTTAEQFNNIHTNIIQNVGESHQDNCVKKSHRKKNQTSIVIRALTAAAVRICALSNDSDVMLVYWQRKQCMEDLFAQNAVARRKLERN